MAFNITGFRFVADPEEQQQQAQEAVQQGETVLQRLSWTGPLARERIKIRRRQRDAYQRKKRLFKQQLHQKRENDTNKPLQRRKELIFGPRMYNVDYHKRQADRIELAGNAVATQRSRQRAEHLEKQATKKYEEFEKHFIERHERSLRQEYKETMRQEFDRLKPINKGGMKGEVNKPLSFLNHLLRWPSARRSDPRARGLARRG